MKTSPPPMVATIRVCRVVLLASTFCFLAWLMPHGEDSNTVHAAASPFIQKNDKQVTSGTTNGVAFSTPTAAGNLIAVYVIWDNTGITTISDSQGNPYISALSPLRWNSGRHSAQVFYAKNVKGGTDTVTARFSTAIRSFGIVYIHEYSQLDRVNPVDGTAAAVGGSGSLNSGTVTTTSTNDLLFGAGVSTNVVTGPGAGYVARDTAQGNITEDQVVTSQGSYNATASNSGGGWGMQLVAFRFAGLTSADTIPPTTPTGLTATPVSPTQVNLSWNASSDSGSSATQLVYRVYRNSIQIGTTPAGTTSWQDSGLTQATTYAYAVAAQDLAGNLSPPSAGVQATTPQVLPSIASFKATPSQLTAGESTTLSWTVSNATTLVVNNGVGNVTSLSSISAKPAATTTYQLTASNSAGSAVATTTVTVSADTAPPSVPNLTANRVSPTRADLNWTQSTDNVGVAGYQIYRDGAALAQTTTTSYSDLTLTAGNSYSYTVSAYDAAGNDSSPSNAVSVMNLTPDTQAPTVSITSPVSNQVVFGSWPVTVNASDNVGVVGVQYVLDGSTLGTESTVAPFSITWNTSQAQDGTHLLTAVARDAAGNAANSTSVTITVSNGFRKPYTTTFPLTENPISENGRWINGQTVGLDWRNIRTTFGLAFGTQTGDVNYADSTALLAGNWGPDQTVEAAVHTVNQPTDNGIFEEVELRLRSSLTPHNATGYEVNFRCSQTSNAYMQIVRWNGPLGSFTILDAREGVEYGVNDGDVIKATILGNVITAYLNGAQVLQVTDGTYQTGNPGMGFYVQGTSGASVNGDYGFTSFTASDGSTIDTAPPSVPTNLAASAVSSSQIKLTWNPSLDDVGVIGYQIFRNNLQIGTSATISFSDNGLVANTPYSYTVAAYDAAGFVSAQSPPVTATTLPPDTTPPSVPTLLQFSNITTGSVSISWPASTDDIAIAGYRVFRNGTQVGTASNPAFSDTGLAPGTTYSYTVAAFDSSNNVSAESSPYQVTTLTAPLSPPSFVQSSQNQTTRGASTSASFSTSTLAGHTIIAYVIWDNTGTATLSDSRGDTFVPVSAPLVWAGKYSAQVFYAKNIVGGTDTVTATFGTSVASFGVLYIHEYAGISSVNPVDVAAQASGSSSTLNSGSITTTSPNDLLFGAGVSDNVVTNPGTGFTARNKAYGNLTEDRVTATPGAVSATATHSGQMWGMQLVAFRAAN